MSTEPARRQMLNGKEHTPDLVGLRKQPTLARLLRLMSPFTAWMVLATLLGFATIGSSVGLMAAAAYIVSKAALHPSIADLQVAIVGVRFFGISRGVFRYLERYVSHQVTFRLLARLRVWFYQALEPLAPARLMHYRSGDLLTRIVADIETLENLYLRALAPPLVAVLVMGLMWWLMGSFDIRLALVLLVFFLLSGLGLPLLARWQTRGLGRQLIAARADLNCALVDGIQGMADLLAFDHQAEHQHLLQRLNQTLVHLQDRFVRFTGLYNALSILSVSWASIVLLVVAIPLVGNGQLNGVYLAVVVLAAVAGFEAVQPLPQAFQHLNNSLAAGRRLFEIVDAYPEVNDEADTSPSPRDYSLILEDVSFRYDEREPLALDGISLSLRPGQRLAVVGPSGAGKSTLVNLLLRFWDYQQGKIWLGGRELHRYRMEDTRRMIGVVSQHTHLFNASVRENLQMARPDATQQDLEIATRRAHIHDFFAGLPQAYDTWIGEQGVRLSAGQRQRLAIARALLQDRPILILDEATANLDPLTERDVLDSIHELVQGRTSLTITHRLVGMETMDEILVLHAGRIVERGRHDELMQADTIYRRMWELQRLL